MKYSIGKTTLLKAMALLGAVVAMPSISLATSPANDIELTSQRVVNGKIVREGEWLSQVSLAPAYNANKPFCGGTLIAPDWVLTAAHCVDGETKSEDIAVTVGLYEYKGFYDINTREGTPNAKEYFKVEEIIINDGWGSNEFDDDVALLKLKGMSSINPAIIYGGTADLRAQYVTTVGFGSIVQQDVSQSKPRFAPGTRRTHDLTVQSNATCEQSMNDIDPDPQGEDYIVYKRDKHICVSVQEGRKGTCQGDSGGPLYVRNAENKIVTAGIVSFGSGCAWPGKPGAFARTSNYIDFIKKHVPDVMVDTKNYQHSVSRDISGAWFDPERSGEGWIVEMQPNNRFSLFWFTFDYLGVPMYLFGSGSYQPGAEQLNVELYKTSGARFGSAFNSSDVSMMAWGSLNFKPKGCDSAMVSYTSSDAMYGNGSRTVVPLYLTNTSNCTGFWDGSKRQVAGTWFSPSRSGEGVVIQTRPNNQFSFYFFTYDMSGNQKTIFGDGTLYNGKGFANAYTVTGPKFKDSDSVFKQSVDVQSWGNIDIQKQNCNSLVMNYNAAGSGYGSGAYFFTRLSHLEGDLCSP